jgi:uncharacterized protein (DUF1501 family)
MKQDRREFLKKSTCALSMVALATQVEHFGMMNAMAQKVDEQNSSSAMPVPYKALVCVFLSGGSDSNNMVVPNHDSTTVSNYAAYAAARQAQGLAIPRASLLPISVPRIGNLTYGLHPNLGNNVNNSTFPGLYDLYAQGKMAVVANVGNLIRPLTKTEYQQNPTWRPYQLFSHSDQVNQQQTARSDTRALFGWGGRISDRTHGVLNVGAAIPMISSVAGVNLFTNGQSTNPLALTPTGPLSQALALQGYDAGTIATARRNALDQLRTMDNDVNLRRSASLITDAAVQASIALSGNIETTVTFPTTNLGNQLKQIARMIKKRNELNIGRQIFYCQLGGFDTHTGQVTSMVAGQNGLLQQVSQAMRAFYDEMVVQGVANDVTMFTMSDFTRTFNPAGSGTNVGSDHAWGGHHLVVGGSVIGGNFYGTNTSNGTPFPTLTMGAAGPDDTDTRGRWIPSSSVEQYAATLARWYGLPEADIPTVFPNLGNFTTSNLGFMTL